MLSSVAKGDVRQNSQILRTVKGQETTGITCNKGNSTYALKKILPLPQRWFGVAQVSRESGESPPLKVLRAHLAP